MDEKRNYRRDLRKKVTKERIPLIGHRNEEQELDNRYRTTRTRIWEGGSYLPVIGGLLRGGMVLKLSVRHVLHLQILVASEGRGYPLSALQQNIYPCTDILIYMVKTFQIDNELHERLKKAVEKVYGSAYGNISAEIRAAIEDRIKVLEKAKKK